MGLFYASAGAGIFARICSPLRNNSSDSGQQATEGKKTALGYFYFRRSISLFLVVVLFLSGRKLGKCVWANRLYCVFRILLRFRISFFSLPYNLSQRFGT
jgi:hypothetical protein